MKTYIFVIIFLFITSLNKVFAVPDIIDGVKNNLPGEGAEYTEVVTKVGGDLINIIIQYVSVLAVIALMISGIMYLISNGEEEKVKKAKTWIIWSLVGVLLSISALGIIQIINNINI